MPETETTDQGARRRWAATATCQTDHPDAAHAVPIVTVAALTALETAPARPGAGGTTAAQDLAVLPSGVFCRLAAT